MTDYDVAICGLGPVGQLLALLLGDHGVPTLAFDRAPDVYPLPRAAVIDDEVLRIFQAAGLDGAVLADGQVQPRASIVTERGRAVEVLRSQTGLLGHPPLVSINQPAMERTMLAALAERPTVEVRRGLTLDALDRHADGVDVYVRPADGGRSERISARFLVGCDGGGSAVRARLHIPFTGKTAPQRWIVVDAKVDRPLRKVPHPHFVGRAERPIVTLPMSPGRHRWEWMLHPGEDPAPFLEPDAVGRAVDEWLDGETADIERAVAYTFHTRTAARWRQGRVLLAGDAAHVMPPFAGQGFSSGARDAGNLAWKLAAVLAGAPQALLDSYETERRPHVAAMQRTANVMGSLVQATGRARIRVRDAYLNGIDGTRMQELMATNVKPLPTYGQGAFAVRPHRIPLRRTVGALFPQTDRLDDRLPRGWVAVTADAVAGSLFEDEGLPSVDPGADRAWLDRHGLTWAVLRPDRYVFAAGDVDGVASACAAWRRVAGTPSRGGDVIAVLGATGHIGRHVARALADQPVEARALVRRPDAVELPLPAVAADLTDGRSVRRALEGADRLFLVTPHGPDQDLLEAAAIDAAREAGVRHVVKISGGAASLGPNGTTATATAHWRSEQRIERSGMGFTFLRPSFFQQNLLVTVAPTVARTGLLLSPLGRAPIAMVDVRDIAACAVVTLLEREPANAAWQLTGPRGVSLDDIAARLGVRHVPIPPRMAARALARDGATPDEIDHALRMAAFFAAGSDSAPTDHVQRLTGRAPRPVEALLDEHRNDFAPATGLARTLSRTATPRSAP